MSGASTARREAWRWSAPYHPTCWMRSTLGSRHCWAYSVASIRRAQVEHVVAVEEPTRLLLVAAADLGGDLRHHRLGVFAELENVDLAVAVAAHLDIGSAREALE